MISRIVPTFIGSFAIIIAVLGCENEIFLIPETIVSDDYSSSYPSTNLVDSSVTSIWIGSYYYEHVYYYFSSPIIVTEIYVHTYGYELDYLRTYAGYQYLSYERSVGPYASRSIKAPNVYVDTSRHVYFYFRTTSSSYLPRISAAHVFGCYDTSTPTSFPTTVGPSNFPSIHPTTLPTMPPVTHLPSRIPSSMPTSSPTMIPTTAEPTSYPSIYPTSSPTSPPSSPIYTTTPTSSPSTVPTIVSLTQYPSIFPSMSPSPFPSAQPSVSPTASPTPLSAEPSQSPTVSPTLLTAEPSLLPSELPTVFEDADGFSLVLGNTSLFVVGGVFFIFCLGLSSLCWFIQRHNRRQKQIISLLNISQKIAMDEIQRTPNIEGESYFKEGQVRNGNRANIQLASILTPSGENEMSDLQIIPNIDDEFFFTEGGMMNDETRRVRVRL